MQHVDGGPCVGQCAVIGGHPGTQQGGQRGQPDAGRLGLGQHLAGEPHGVHHGRTRPWQTEPRAGGLQEADVERRIVRNKDGPPDELQERRQHGADPRCVVHHRIGDPGQDGDLRRDRPAGVDQGRELAEHLTAPDLHRPDLGDGLRQRRSTGGLQVDHDEGDLTQWLAQFVEAALDIGSRANDRFVRRLRVEPAERSSVQEQ